MIFNSLSKRIATQIIKLSDHQPLNKYCERLSKRCVCVCVCVIIQLSADFSSVIIKTNVSLAYQLFIHVIFIIYDAIVLIAHFYAAYIMHNLLRRRHCEFYRIMGEISAIFYSLAPSDGFSPSRQSVTIDGFSLFSPFKPEVCNDGSRCGHRLHLETSSCGIVDTSRIHNKE